MQNENKFAYKLYVVGIIVKKKKVKNITLTRVVECLVVEIHVVIKWRKVSHYQATDAS